MLSFRNFAKRFSSANNTYIDIDNIENKEENYKKAEKYRHKYHKKTNSKISDDQVESVARYLSNSKPVDDYYLGRNSDKEAIKDAKTLETIIKRIKTEDNMILYRGFTPSKEINKDDTITHHGITSYGSTPNFAEMYNLQHIIKLKVPKGTHAAYIENIAQERKFKYSGKTLKRLINSGGEGNWILHPNTKIKITNAYQKGRKFYYDAELIRDGAK